MTEENFIKAFSKNPNWYQEVPFLSIAKELLQVLKEIPVSKLVIVSASNGKRKNDKFFKTFGKFPNVELSIQKTNSAYKKLKERKKYRWEWIEEEHPDFDIFIDDDCFTIKNSLENFPPDKIYVTPDYKCNRDIQAPNIYHVKQEVSDLTDEDFVKAAQEYQQKKQQEQQTRSAPVTVSNQEREREREHLKATLPLFSLCKRNRNLFIRNRDLLIAKQKE